MSTILCWELDGLDDEFENIRFLSQEPSGRKNIALIGAGPQGGFDNMFERHRVVGVSAALCLVINSMILRKANIFDHFVKISDRQYF